MSKLKRVSNGKDPISQKTDLTMEFGNRAKSMMDIPKECQQELDKSGMEGRWIDIVKLKTNHGWHKREWQPFKFTCLDQKNNPFGAPDGQYEGYLIRQQLVLAAKSKDKVAQRKAYIKARTDMQADPGKLKINEFKQLVRDTGSKIRVHEGYDEDGQDQEETV